MIQTTTNLIRSTNIQPLSIAEQTLLKGGIFIRPYCEEKRRVVRKPK